MDTESAHLRSHGFDRNLVLLGLPRVPMLPRVAAAPAGHEQNAELVGHVEEHVVLHLALEADGVEVQVQHVLHLGLNAPARRTQKEIWSPAGTTNQDALPIDRVEAILLRIELGAHLPNAEASGERVENARRSRGHVVRAERKREVVQARGAHLPRPPELRLGDIEHAERGVAKEDLSHLVGLERDGLREVADAVDRAVHRAKHGRRGMVRDLHHDGEMRRGSRR